MRMREPGRTGVDAGASCMVTMMSGGTGCADPEGRVRDPALSTAGLGRRPSRERAAA